MKEAPCACGGELERAWRRLGRRRIARALVLGAFAILLAGAGPAWNVPPGLVLLGAVLLLSFAGATFLCRAVAGAAPRAGLVCMPLLVAASAVAAWVRPPAVEDRPVLVEEFWPPGSGPSPSAPSIEVPGIDVVVVAYDLAEGEARDRFGALSRLGGSVAEEDAEAVPPGTLFVNGVLVGRLSRPEDLIRRDAEEPPDPRVSEITVDALADGARRVIVVAPVDARCTWLEAVRPRGSSGRWRAVAVRSPRAERMAPQGELGESPDGVFADAPVRHEMRLEPSTPDRGPGAEAGNARGDARCAFLLVSLDGRVLALRRLEAGG